MALVGAATVFACTPFLDAPGADFSPADSDHETEFTRLKAERPVIDAWFGYSLSWGGDALVVTAPFESYSSDAGVIERAGAVYMFEPSLGTYNPRDQKRIELPYAGPWDGTLRDGFDKPTVLSALHVVLDARSIFVGAAGDDGSSEGTPNDKGMPESGALYVYDRSRMGPPQYLKAPVVKKNSQFGYALALSEQWLIVGAPGDDGESEQDGAVDSGAFYGYRRDGDRLEAPRRYEGPLKAQPGDYFGGALALDGDRLFVGAPREAGGFGGIDGDMLDNSLPNSGAVYVYRLVGDEWVYEHYLKPDVPQEGMWFGTVLSVSNHTLAVGAPGPGTVKKPLKGSVTTFREQNGTWEIEQTLAPDDSGVIPVGFGWAVSLSGDRLLVGVPFDSSASAADPADRSLESAGAAYSFVRAGTGGWVRQAYLKAPEPGARDFFGTSIALLPGYLALGAVEGARAPGDSADPGDNAVSGPGSVYLFPVEPSEPSQSGD